MGKNKSGVCAMAEEDPVELDEEEVEEDELIDLTTAKLLSTKDIIDAPDLDITPIYVPEWKGVIFLRLLTGKEREELLKKNNDFEKDEPDGYFTPHILGHMMCDKDGGRLFATAKAIKALGQKASCILERLANEGLDLNGMQSKAVEAAAKN